MTTLHGFGVVLVTISTKLLILQLKWGLESNPRPMDSEPYYDLL